jgi:hypothetical protein
MRRIDSHYGGNLFSRIHVPILDICFEGFLIILMWRLIMRLKVFYEVFASAFFATAFFSGTRRLHSCNLLKLSSNNSAEAKHQDKERIMIRSTEYMETTWVQNMIGSGNWKILSAPVRRRIMIITRSSKCSHQYVNSIDYMQITCSLPLCQREASGISPTARINDDPAGRSPTPRRSYPYSSIV